MARNSEKAMTALARWRKAKEAEEGLDTKSERRPYLGKYFVILNRMTKNTFNKLILESLKFFVL